jgi:hypothetical protein
MFRLRRRETQMERILLALLSTTSEGSAKFSLAEIRSRIRASLHGLPELVSRTSAARRAPGKTKSSLGGRIMNLVQRFFDVMLGVIIVAIMGAFLALVVIVLYDAAKGVA